MSDVVRAKFRKDNPELFREAIDYAMNKKMFNFNVGHDKKYYMFCADNCSDCIFNNQISKHKYKHIGCISGGPQNKEVFEIIQELYPEEFIWEQIIQKN